MYYHRKICVVIKLELYKKFMLILMPPFIPIAGNYSEAKSLAFLVDTLYAPELETQLYRPFEVVVIVICMRKTVCAGVHPII